MKASEVKLDDFLSKVDTQFVIPIYQRNYEWRRPHCEQLLNDIIEVGTTHQPHFIGSIVFIHDGVYTSGVKELIIIDGQQRLTTITLLFIALYHYALNNNDYNNLAQKIYKKYLINEFANDEQRLKLKPTENNDSDLKSVLTNSIHTSEFSNIINNYNFFKNRITSENINAILDGLQMLMFVEISLDRNYDNAQRIFESLNSTGLELSQADLIRNYILMELTASQQKEIYNNFWECIEKNTRIDGVNKLPDFIRDYLTSTKENIVNKNEVYHTFKNEFPIKDYDCLTNILSHIKQLSIPYGRLINPMLESDVDIRKQIDNINRLEINTSYPFLMRVYDDYIKTIIEKDTFIRILQFIQTYSFRRYILDLPTNTLNKIFMSLYDKIDKDNYEESLYVHILRFTGKQRMPNDEEITEALKDKDIYHSKAKNKDFLFENLENWGNREIVDIVNNDNITIEHIFPQNPNLEWRTDLSKEDFSDFSSKYLHTIGNLTLSGNNGKLGNRGFVYKRDMNDNDGEQGYKYSRLWLNTDLKQLNEWSVRNYKARTKRLTKRFLQIWAIPQININQTEDGEVNIFDADDPTGKKLEYAKFFGRIFRNRNNENALSYASFYHYIAKNIYDLAPEEFISNFAESLSISSNIEDLNRPKAISDTYYIETNLSGADIFKRIKQILKAFNLDEELYIKYSSNS